MSLSDVFSERISPPDKGRRDLYEHGTQNLLLDEWISHKLPESASLLSQLHFGLRSTAYISGVICHRCSKSETSEPIGRAVSSMPRSCGISLGNVRPRIKQSFWGSNLRRRMPERILKESTGRHHHQHHRRVSLLDGAWSPPHSIRLSAEWIEPRFSTCPRRAMYTDCQESWSLDSKKIESRSSL